MDNDRATMTVPNRAMTGRRGAAFSLRGQYVPGEADALRLRRPAAPGLCSHKAYQHVIAREDMNPARRQGL